MDWRIDTGMVGEVKPKELRKVLEDSRDHWRKTQAEAAGFAAAAAAGPAPTDPTGAVAHSKKVGAAADAMQKAHFAKSETLLAHMEQGIKAACALADVFSGVVVATIVGHENERHPSGCAKRIQVSVDQTWRE